LEAAAARDMVGSLQAMLHSKWPPSRGLPAEAHRNGVPDEEIMGHTRHRSLTTMRSYVRWAKLGQASPAGKVGL
jgi:hypothetical protein